MKRINLDQMKNMSIDNLIELYRNGYRLEEHIPITSLSNFHNSNNFSNNFSIHMLQGPLLDPVVNFGKVTVSTGYDAIATSIILNTNEGSKLPDPTTGAFNIVWWNSTDYPDPSDDPNKEIVRCTAKTTDTLTVTRSQEGTSASIKNLVGKTYKMILSPTAKTISDISSAITARVAKAGDTMTGTLNLPTNGLIVGTNQLILSGGNVGIGTSIPTSLLDVNGTVQLRGIIGGTGLTVDAGGKVGIGTTSPASILEVREITGTGSGIKYYSNQTGSVGSQLIFDISPTGGGQNDALLKLYDGTTSAVVIAANNSRGGNTYFNGGGNVGIGTTSPSAILHTVGSINLLIGNNTNNNDSKVGVIAALQYTNTNIPFGLLTSVVDGGANAVNIGGGRSVITAATVISLYTAADNNTVFGTERMRIDNSGKVGIGTNIVGIPPNTILQINPANDINAFSIREPPSGTPTQTLVRISFGDIATEAKMDMYLNNVLKNVFRTNGNNYITGGNVGIGTTAPTTKLQIVGRAGAFGVTNFDTTLALDSDFPGLSFGKTGTGQSAVIRVNDVGVASPSNRLSFYTGAAAQNGIWSSVEALSILENGNVGIGTTSPNSLLVVSGGQASFNGSTDGAPSVHIGNTGIADGIVNSGDNLYVNIDSNNDQINTAFIVGNDRTGKTGGTELFRVSENGKVGIGIAVPTTKLHVSGRAGAFGVTNFDNTLALDSDLPGISFGKTGTGLSAAIRVQDVGVASPSNRLSFYTGPAVENGVWSATEALSILENGNVGIGTSNPQTKLHVEGDGTLFVVGTGTTPTTNHKLLVGKDTGTFFEQQGNSVLSGSDRLRIQTSKSGDSVNYLTLLLDPTNGNYLAASGTAVDKLGIGQTVPSAKLDIVADDAENTTVLEVNQLDTGISIAATIINASTGDGLFLDQNGNGVGLHIDNDGIANSITVEGTTTTDLIVNKTGELYGSVISNQWSNRYAADILGLTTGPVFLNTLIGTPVTDVANMIDVSGSAHNGTYKGTWSAAQRVNKGFGWTLNPNGTDNYISFGDHNDFSFGDGVNDIAFTIAGVIEVVAGTVLQIIASKYTDTDVPPTYLREWYLGIDALEKMVLFFYDESADKGVSRTSDVPISEGFHTYVVSYTGVGGATAANGITLYIDGVLIASTAVNDVLYVSMDNLTAEMFFGAQTIAGTPANFLKGDFIPPIIDKGYVWDATDVRRFHLYAKEMYNL